MVVATACLVLINFHDKAWAPPGPPASGPYAVSAHGSNIARTVANGYATGNCYHCHEMHASYQGAAPAPAAGSPDIYLGFEEEEVLCFGCHGSGGIGSVTAPNGTIGTIMARAYGHGTGTTLNVTGNSGRHRANETTVTPVVNTAHVECTDCHNPHRARVDATGRHTVGTNLIDVPGPLEGVSGVEFSPYPSNWANLISWPAAAGVQPYATATKEYQICFKCHSSANANTDDWDGVASGAGAWTDTALEFNRLNPSYHPIVDTLGNGPNVLTTNGAPKGLVAAQLLAPWNATPGTNLMYCSDCHESGTAAPFGPHGSTVKWMLRGTYTNWPFRASADNGTATGTASNWAYLTNGGTEDDTFCQNCHPDTNSASSNNVHTTGDHKNATDGRCLTCHIRVPHGGKVSRLINAATTASNLPARYWPNGAGAGFTPEMHRFNKGTRTGYGGSNSNCSVRTCRGSHNIGTGESW